MPVVYGPINTDMGAEAEVLRKLKKVQGVREAYTVYGAYKILARVEAKTIEELKETITKNIKHLEKVRSTRTLIVVKP